MSDEQLSEEEYQKELDKIRERDLDLYTYILWGNNHDEPFDYDAFEKRLLTAVQEPARVEQLNEPWWLKPFVDLPVSDEFNIHRHYYSRKNDPEMPRALSSGDGFIVSLDDIEQIPEEHELLTEQHITWFDKMPYDRLPTEIAESAIDWPKIEAFREETEFRDRWEEVARKIVETFHIPSTMLFPSPVAYAANSLAADIQCQEICIETLVGRTEMIAYRDELREAASMYVSRRLYAKAHQEFYHKVYMLCAEGYTLEQILHGVKKLE